MFFSKGRARPGKDALDGNQGLQTPWSNVNKLVKGFQAGDLIIVSAPPKIGKTTWCLDIARNLTRQGTPVLFWCMEMRAERLVRKVRTVSCRYQFIITEL